MTQPNQTPLSDAYCPHGKHGLEECEPCGRYYYDGYAPSKPNPATESAEPSDAELAGIARGLEDIEAGRTASFEAVKRQVEQPKAPQRPVEVRVLTSTECIADLRRIFLETQSKFHDERDWMDAEFNVACLEAQLAAKEADLTRVRAQRDDLAQELSDAELAKGAMKKKIAELEGELRRLMWASHRHQMIYGDDGEMQCGECSKYGCWDYKNAPLAEVRAAYDMAIRELRPNTRAEAERDRLRELLERAISRLLDSRHPVNNELGNTLRAALTPPAAKEEN